MKYFSLGSLNGLVDRHGQPSKRLQKLPDDELLSVLIEYKTKALKRQDHVGASGVGLATLRSSLSTELSSPNFLASAIAYDRVFFDDPIARLARTTSKFSFGDVRVNREQLATIISSMNELKPLIDSGVLIPLCLSAKHDKEEVPLTFSEDRFRSCLPDAVLQFAHENAVVRPGEMAGGPIVIYEKEVDEPVDCISVSFANDNRKLGQIWQLTDCEMKPDGRFEFAVNLDSRKRKTPSYDKFSAWVEQSINQTTLSLLREVSVELDAAEKLGAHYATESGFEANLLSFGQSGSLEGAVANPANLLTACAPPLKVNDPIAVHRFRRENKNRIEDFQASLFAMAAALYDSDNFAAAAKREYDAKIRPQVEALDQAWAKCCGTIAKSGSLAAAAVATMCLKFPDLPVTFMLPTAALGAVGTAMPTIAEFRAKRKSIAFLWQKLS
ncbi:MAG: hypothetical protein IT422_19660 [Pirellulaceae bacterium]|nr:hypothetical protein [Pirellulaceae bacterium]